MVRLRHKMLAAFSIAYVAGLAGCANPLPFLLDDDTAVISGNLTQGESRPAAVKTVISRAAVVTIDHGYEYFRILSDPSSPETSDHSRGTSAIQPGMDVAIK